MFVWAIIYLQLLTADSAFVEKKMVRVVKAQMKEMQFFPVKMFSPELA